MSRIHEALKKAEQERATVQTTDAPVAVASEVALPALPPWPARSNTAGVTEIPSAPASITAPSAEYLRFDELRARCAHPVWRPDPNVNVFGNEALSPHAAEQFRTLR